MSKFFVFFIYKISSWYKQGYFRKTACNTGVCFVFLAIVLSLVSCNQDTSSSTQSPAGTQVEAVTLPTGAPTPEPTPVNTRVLPIEILTPAPSPTVTPIPDEVMGLVVDVIDGDTIAVVLDGDRARRAYQVRYLGIDAPENVPGNPWGVVAYETNQKLTKLKIVRLVRDQTDFDAEGYLLRYVYVGDQMLSILLAEQGLARAAIEEPNTRFETDIRNAEARARQGQLGLWGPQPPTPSVTPGKPPTSGGGAALETPSPTTPGVTDITPTQELTPTGTITATVEITPQATEEKPSGSETPEQ